MGIWFLICSSPKLLTVDSVMKLDWDPQSSRAQQVCNFPLQSLTLIWAVANKTQVTGVSLNVWYVAWIFSCGGRYSVVCWVRVVIVRVIKARIMKWAGHVTCIGEERGCIWSWWGKPEGKSPPGRPRRNWVVNIRMALQEVGCGYMYWIGRSQGRDSWGTLESALINLRAPWYAGNF